MNVLLGVKRDYHNNFVAFLTPDLAGIVTATPPNILSCYSYRLPNDYPLKWVVQDNPMHLSWVSLTTPLNLDYYLIISPSYITSALGVNLSLDNDMIAFFYHVVFSFPLPGRRRTGEGVLRRLQKQGCGLP